MKESKSLKINLKSIETSGRLIFWPKVDFKSLTGKKITFSSQIKYRNEKKSFLDVYFVEFLSRTKKERKISDVGTFINSNEFIRITYNITVSNEIEFIQIYYDLPQNSELIIEDVFLISGLIPMKVKI